MELEKLIDKFKGFSCGKIRLLRVAALEGSGENSSVEKMPLEPDLEENGRLPRGGDGEDVKKTEGTPRS